MKRNADLFTLIEHAVPPEKYRELENLWKTPREKVKDEDWVAKTRSVMAMGPVEDEGGALWARWRDLVGWESDDEEGDEYDWEPPSSNQDTALHRRWSDLEKPARPGDELGTSAGSGIGLSVGGAMGLSEINEEEEEFEDGEHPVSVGGRIKKSSS